jgi:hypothetical protein
MATEIDLFGDMMGQDHAGFGALQPIEHPQKQLASAPQGTYPEGIVISYHCPSCSRPDSLLLSWAEIYIVAHGIRPQPVVGIRDVWQADAEYATGFGYATRCRSCQNDQAPFTYGIVEAQQDLQKYPFFKLDKNVQAVAPLVQNVLRSGTIPR